MEVVLVAVALLAGATIALSTAPLSATPLTGFLLAVAAVLALASPPAALVATVALVTAFVVDTVLTRRPPRLHRAVATVLARGVGSPLVLTAEGPAGAGITVRQPQTPDLRLDPPQGAAPLETTLVARRRGRHDLPRVVARVRGPLGLAAWYRAAGHDTEVLVYPDVPAARRIARAVRQGRFRDPGRLTRGPLGLGTDFERVRDYVPDDDVRQINWLATQRMGRPMSNEYRVEQDREVICMVDCGRLLASPVGDRTRLDAALDCVAAIALVADEVGDRVGVIAFDSELRRRLAPRRNAGQSVIRAVFDLEPRGVDSDYELAFQSVGAGKRAFVIVLTDLLDEAAATSLLGAMDVLTRRHVVAVATVTDPDIAVAVTETPRGRGDVFLAAAALDVLDARDRTVTRLRRAGADVVEAPPDVLAAACVGAYLNAKTRARL